MQVEPKFVILEEKPSNNDPRVFEVVGRASSKVEAEALRNLLQVSRTEMLVIERWA